MLVNIRDDDTNFFTNPVDLRRAYEDLIGDIPVTLAVIPFVTRHYSRMLHIEGVDRLQQLAKQRSIEKILSAQEMGEDQKVYPFGENTELVQFLMKLIRQNKIEIALHGFNHRYYEDGAELIKNHISFFHVRDGKEYLEKLFGARIYLFVPPSNAINMKAYRWLCDLDLGLLTSSSISTDSYIEKLQYFFCMAAENPRLLLNKAVGKSQYYNFKLFGNQVLYSVTFKLNDSAESFLQNIKSNMSSFGHISIATHYKALSEDEVYRYEFHLLIKLIRKEYPLSQFVTAHEMMRSFG